MHEESRAEWNWDQHKTVENSVGLKIVGKPARNEFGITNRAQDTQSKYGFLNYITLQPIT